MNIERLPSGSYRITQLYKGKRYRKTVDHKPTSVEAAQIVSELIGKAVPSSRMTFKNAAEVYIESRLNVVSPTTERGYRSVLRNVPEWFLRLRIGEIARNDVQRLINDYSGTHSPKSTRNLSGFVSAVVKYHGGAVSPVTLPQKSAKRPYIPTKEEVHAIFQEIKGTKYEVPIMLAAMGLRRSEICALTPEDLEGNVLTISKAKVQNERKEWVIKTTKTVDSTRSIVLPDYLADLIRERGFYDGHPELIYRTLTNAQTKLGIQHFPLHKLRHFFASYLHNLGTFSEKQIQEMGGWKNPQVLQGIYTHSMEMERAKSEAASVMQNLI